MVDDLKYIPFYHLPLKGRTTDNAIDATMTLLIFGASSGLSFNTRIVKESHPGDNQPALLMSTDNIPTENVGVRTAEPIFEKRRSTINAIKDHSPMFHLIMGAAVNCLKIRVPVHCRTVRPAVLLLRTCMWRRQRTPDPLYPHTATELVLHPIRASQVSLCDNSENVLYLP